jgi:hypothetical protein
MQKAGQAVLHLFSRCPSGWSLLFENLFLPACSAYSSIRLFSSSHFCNHGLSLTIIQQALRAGLPFHAEFYFNGHNAIQLQLDRQGIQYRLKDNAFVEVEDPDALQKAAESLDGRAVLNRINSCLPALPTPAQGRSILQHITQNLLMIEIPLPAKALQAGMDMFFRFDKGKYSTRSKFLEHGWYLSQIEISSNVVFRSARYCTSLFERLLDKFHRLGLPETIAQIFNRRLHRPRLQKLCFKHCGQGSTSKTFWRLYDNNACIKHWFRGNSIKQYNKTGYYIRTETTINNPKSLGLQKPVLFLQACPHCLF